jgi:uncharacterized protein (TIGR02001 family)
MKKLVFCVAAAAVLGVMPALAADMRPAVMAPPPPPSPWDIAFGGALMTDYNFRGISQSNKGPSVTAYSETRYTVNPSWQLYAGSQYWAVTLPTNPTCECDLYVGVRPTFGAWAFDFGYMYYWYPKERQHATGAIPAAPFPAFPNGNSTLRNTDYEEIYGKVMWEALKDKFWLGASVYYSPSWLNTGASGTYVSGTAKWAGAPFRVNIGPIDELGWYLSGEVGHYSFGTTDFVPGVFGFGGVGINLPDYTTWNVGLAFTYKVFTLDVRYYDTDLSKSNCNTLTGDPNANGVPLGSKWCGSTVIAKFSADLTVATNVK